MEWTKAFNIYYKEKGHSIEKLIYEWYWWCESYLSLKSFGFSLQNLKEKVHPQDIRQENNDVDNNSN